MSLEEDKQPVSVGPWGGQGGSSWDDGVYSTVRQLVIAHGAGIDSIQIEYDNKGNSLWSRKHGGDGGSKTDKVKLDSPDEFLTSIHGYYGSLHGRGPILVRSLTLQSNRKTYGPFGVEQGTSFTMTKGKIVGFYGRSGLYLDAIGVYSKPIMKLNPSKTIIQAQSFPANGAERGGFSLIQGSVGESYDIVLAVRQKDAFGNPLPREQNPLPREQNPLPREQSAMPRGLSRQSSSSSSDDSSDVETKSKVSIQTPEKVPPKVSEGVLTYGPWGGNGGIKFDDRTYTGIRQINLSRNIGIVSIKVCYDHNGQAVWGSKHGGTGGFKTDRIMFDYPSEILTHITGTYGPLMYMGPNVIKSLTFHTNKGKHGPYGDEQGPSFTNKVNEGKIVGFLGREGLFLDAIGVHVLEGKVPPPKPPLSQAIIQSEMTIAEIDNSPWSNKLVLARRRHGDEEVACGVVKETATSGPGPWGGEGGRAWDDGVYYGIKQIFITKSDLAICSIQIEYDRNGQSVWSQKHGGNGGTSTHRIKLEYPNEVLIRISGYYGCINNDEKSKFVRSLTFYSSRSKYGPFGEEMGTYFTSTEGKVVGFHGRGSSYLDAIGVHMQYWLGNQRTSRMSLFKIFT